MRRVPVASSEKDASRRHRAMTSSARFALSFVVKTFALGLADQFRRRPSRNHQRNQHRPTITIPVGRTGLMIAQHEKHDWYCDEGVVLRSQLGLRAEIGVEGSARGGGSDHLALRRQNSEPDICSHDRPKDCSQVNVSRAPAEHVQQAP